MRCVSSDSVNNREIRIHVYRKRQTSDSSREFLSIENKQIKTVRTIPMVKTGIKLATDFCVEAKKSKRKTWSCGTNSPLPFSVNVYLSSVWHLFTLPDEKEES